MSLYLDTSDDDSIYQPQLKRGSPIKKTGVVNIFSSSSDGDSDDEEIATLTGSQPLSLTDGSQASPGVTTQPSSIEKPLKAAIEKGLKLSKAAPKAFLTQTHKTKPRGRLTRQQDQDNHNPSRKSAVEASDISKKLEIKPIQDNARAKKTTTDLPVVESIAAKELSSRNKKRSTEEVEPIQKKASREEATESKQLNGVDSMNRGAPTFSDLNNEVEKGNGAMEETKCSKLSQSVQRSKPASKKCVIANEEPLAAKDPKVNEAVKLKAVYAKATKSSSPLVTGKTGLLQPNKLSHASTPITETVVTTVPLQQSKSDKVKADAQPAYGEYVPNQEPVKTKSFKKRSAASSQQTGVSADSKDSGGKLLEQPKTSSVDKLTTEPPKKKSKKMSFQDQVVNRLFWSFKPFTLRTLAEDLKTTEQTLEFCLLSLIDKGLVIKKDFTSSKGRVKTLYWANHDVKSKEVHVGKESNLEDREKTKHTVQTLQAGISTLKTELSQVLLQPSNSELLDQVAKAENELLLVQQRADAIKSRIEARRALTKANNAQERSFGPVFSSVTSPLSLRHRINHMRNEWKVRKAKCKSFVDLLADGLEKKPKDVIKLLELDTDQMNNATIPEKHVV